MKLAHTISEADKQLKALRKEQTETSIICLSATAQNYGEITGEGQSYSIIKLL